MTPTIETLKMGLLFARDERYKEIFQLIAKLERAEKRAATKRVTKKSDVKGEVK